jgi:hypothetical protein
LKDVIFLWNHNHGSPRKIRKRTDEPSNHYTLLELLSDKKKEELPPDQVFYLNHYDPLTPTQKKKVIEVSSTTESKKAKSSIPSSAEDLKDSDSKNQPTKPKADSENQPTKPKARRRIFVEDEDSLKGGKRPRKKRKIVVPPRQPLKPNQKDTKTHKDILASLEAKIPRKIKKGNEHIQSCYDRHGPE